jgi:hypothetical protein
MRLGFVVVSTLVLVEIFGSPYMRNIQVKIKILLIDLNKILY